jgi:hypothetical protein
VTQIPDGFRELPSGKLMPIGIPFQPGNEESRRGGRPKGLARRIREMVGDDPARVANVLFDILENQSGKEKSSDRIAAAREILDRGWGRAPSYAPIIDGDPLNASEVDQAIREIANQLLSRRPPVPIADAEVVHDGADAN